MSNAAVAEQWVKVCGVSDLIAHSGVAALLGDQQVAVFYLPGETEQVFVVDNHDPFSGANVLSRAIVGDLGGRLVIASPIYKQHFDLRNGECLEDDSVSIACWPAKIMDDHLFISC